MGPERGPPLGPDRGRWAGCGRNKFRKNKFWELARLISTRFASLRMWECCGLLNLSILGIWVTRVAQHLFEMKKQIRLWVPCCSCSHETGFHSQPGCHFPSWSWAVTAASSVYALPALATLLLADSCMNSYMVSILCKAHPQIIRREHTLLGGGAGYCWYKCLVHEGNSK